MLRLSCLDTRQQRQSIECGTCKTLRIAHGELQRHRRPLAFAINGRALDPKLCEEIIDIVNVVMKQRNIFVARRQRPGVSVTRQIRRDDREFFRRHLHKGDHAFG